MAAPRHVDSPRVAAAGRVDPKDLALVAVHLIDHGAKIENKSDIVYYTFRFMAEVAAAQNPALETDAYYDQYFQILQNIGIEFTSPRDTQDKIKALIRDSLEEYTEEDQEEILMLMQDLRKKAKRKHAPRSPKEEDTPSIDELLNELGGE